MQDAVIQLQNDVIQTWVQEELWRSSNQLLTQSRDKLGHKIMFRLSPRKNTPQPLLACTSGFEDLCAGKFPFISQDFPFSSLLHHVLLLCTSVMSLPLLSH